MPSSPPFSDYLAEAEKFVSEYRELVKQHEAMNTDLTAQLAEAVALLRELHANMNHQTGPGCCPSGRFLARVDGAK